MPESLFESALHGLRAGLAAANSVLWHPWILYCIIVAGIICTVATRFGQRHALRLGLRMLAERRGRGPVPSEGGSGKRGLSHFQVLTAALSGTVGIGNIGGTALAISMGGPGAIFWMWMAGLLGMAIKIAEVSLSLRYRQRGGDGTPFGGPMWVATKALQHSGVRGKSIGKVVAASFCVTLLIASFTGGNFFQGYNIGQATREGLGLSPALSATVAGVIVAMVILGGVQRIGAVTERLVPWMCGLYLLSGAVVVLLNIDQVPDLLLAIIAGALSESEAVGAFVGGSAGFAFATGMPIGLFSNESGQGSSPMIHATVDSDQPQRGALLAGLEPFFDTLVVCSMTAMVIFSSGVWSRAPDLAVDGQPVIEGREGRWQLADEALNQRTAADLKSGDAVFRVLEATPGTSEPGSEQAQPQRRLLGQVHLKEGGAVVIEWPVIEEGPRPVLRDAGLYRQLSGAALTATAFDRKLPGWGALLVTLATWLFGISTMITWSYYGERAVLYLWPKLPVRIYRVVYAGLIPLAGFGLVRSTADLNSLAQFGTGVMLMVNLPLTVYLVREVRQSVDVCLSESPTTNG